MNYSGIIVDDFADGLGVRVALYVSGCKFHCEGCHNLKSQDYNFGKPYTEETEQKLLELISQPFVSGLSILGGDPLWQNSEGIWQLISLCYKTKAMGKNVWIWSGFTWEQIFPRVCTDDLNIERIAKQELIKTCDVFVDGLYENYNRDITLPFRGSTNQRIIDIQKSLTKNEVTLFEE